MFNKEFDVASVSLDCSSESHKLLNTYIRFMLRKYNLGIYTSYLSYSCPKYGEYLSHINRIILSSREHAFYGKKEYLCNQTNCKEIDILLRKFVLKQYKIRLIYSNNRIYKKNNFLKPFRINLIVILIDIVFYLKPKQTSSIKTKKYKSKTFVKPNFLILSHLRCKKNKIYNYLADEISNFLNKHNIQSTTIMPNTIGLTYSDKFKIILNIINKLFLLIKGKKSISITNFHFIVINYFNKIYKEKIKRYLIEQKISTVITDYIDIRYGPFYYAAAKELKIKYFTFDYSIGYPIIDPKLLRYHPDKRKHGDIIFSNSIFRSEQYKKASQTDKNIKIRPHICPQIDFSIKNAKTNIDKNNNYLTIAIVDNILGQDLSLNYEDLSTLIKQLINKDFKFKYLLQSKKGELVREFKKLKVNPNNYTVPIKGNLSLLKISDIIISLGWQSTALKGSSIFNKPIIFYSQKGYPYSNNIFSLEKDKNRRIDEYCKYLWWNEKNFDENMDKLVKNKNYFNFIDNVSTKLIDEIGFYKGNLEDYFNLYFK
jgi:hypothetical protein